MIDVQKYIIKTMKKEIFNTSDEINKAGREVLAEFKTKLKDIVDEINPQIQNKILKKMSSDRSNSCEIYKKAGRDDLAIKESNENIVIMQLIQELEKELPKQLSEDEIKVIMKNNNFKDIGSCMRWFKENYPDQDKKNLASIFKSL